ncbi:hypothetical protein D3C85_1013430 [compost metagenome]
MGCLGRNHTKDDSDVEINISNDGLKDITDYRMSFLKSSKDKVLDILGEPDEKGNSPSYRTGHLIYYSKVKDNGRVKHLVFYYARIGNNFEITIEDIKAIGDGEEYFEPTYGRFVVRKMNKPIITGYEGMVKQIDLVVDSITNQNLNRYDQITKYGDATFWYSNDLDLKKVVVRRNINSYEIISYEYYFAQTNLKYVHQYTDSGKGYRVKKYIHNDHVIATFYNGVKGNCKDSYSCEYDRRSEPYGLQEIYWSNQGD